HDTQVRPLRRPQRVPRARSASEPELELQSRPQEGAAAEETPPVDAHAPAQEQQEQQEDLPPLEHFAPRAVQLVARMISVLAAGEKDPLAANGLAFHAGLAQVLMAKQRHEAEADKRAVLAILVDQRMQQGQARTPAERDARHAPEYVQAEHRIAVLEQHERLAELVHRIAYQRAQLLISADASRLMEDVRSLTDELDADE